MRRIGTSLQRAPNRFNGSYGQVIATKRENTQQS
jgi:hypothetical protein